MIDFVISEVPPICPSCGISIHDPLCKSCQEEFDRLNELYEESQASIQEQTTSLTDNP